MSKKNHCGVLVVLLVIAILPPGFAMAQSDLQKEIDAIERCKAGKFEEAKKIKDQISDPGIKEDLQKTIDAIEKSKAGKFVEAKEIAERISNADIKKKTKDQIEDLHKARDVIEKSKAGMLKNAVDTAVTISDPKLRKEAMGEIGDQEATKFWSNFGVGLVANFASGQKRPVKSASIINGIVRVDEEDYLKYGLGLEVHKFLWGTSWGASPRQPFSGAIAVGPYVSVLPGTNNLIDAIGGGIIMGIYGARTSSLVGEKPASPAVPESIGSKLSMNIAIGGFADPGTQVLADGFEENKPAPAGETTVRYKTITQYGFQFVLSFSYEF